MNRLMTYLRLLTRMNWIVSLAIVALIVIGTLFIYSSCYVNDEQPARSLYKKQMLWAAVGLVCYTGFAIVDYRRLRKFSWPAYVVSVALLAMVLVCGARFYGARRWLLIFGMSIQPSEPAKLATIFLLARKLSRPGINLGQGKTLATILAIVAVPMLLIIKQPDLGTAMIFLPITFVMMFIAGVPLRSLGILAGMGCLVVGIVIGAVFLPEKFGMNKEEQRKIMGLFGLSEYHKKRIEVFIAPDKDPLGAGWNKRQSEIAVGSGGLWGKGFVAGTQNTLGFLPRSVAPTDFIYSVIAEEKGFIASAAVLFLFSVLVAFGMRAAVMVRDKTGRLVCAGIATMIFCHACINIAMTVGLMPITGLPLPLLSYGGSFMIVVMSALGIVQSVYIRAHYAG